MRPTFAQVVLLASTSIITVGLIGVAPLHAQTQVQSIEELRQELTPGDVITVVPIGGQPVVGRLRRVGPIDLDIQLTGRHPPRQLAARELTIPFDAIQSLERPRDSSRNGVLIGAGIGAGFGGAMFVHALVIDRNEIDEWAAPYFGVSALSIGIAAFLGWAMDAARSKPHIRFDASAAQRTKLRVQPLYAGDRGIALVMSF